MITDVHSTTTYTTWLLSRCSRKELNKFFCYISHISLTAEPYIHLYQKTIKKWKKRKEGEEEGTWGVWWRHRRGGGVGDVRDIKGEREVKEEVPGVVFAQLWKADQCTNPSRSLLRMDMYVCSQSIPPSCCMPFSVVCVMILTITSNRHENRMGSEIEWSTVTMNFLRRLTARHVHDHES